MTSKCVSKFCRLVWYNGIMRKFLEYFLPMGAGFFIMFYALPNYGGDLEVLVEKTALDWEIPLLALRIILSVALALVLCILFGLLARIALWMAIILVLAAIFAPAALQNIQIVTPEVKQIVEQKIQELDIGK